MKNHFIKHCGVCNSPSLDLLWDLPKFPLTEKYGAYNPQNQMHYDQQLLICDQCGHVQLGMQISPKFLYTPSEYSFRTSQSTTARLGTEFFFQFFNKVCGAREYNSLLDIGGNDLFLAKMAKVPNRWVIDPVCSSQDGQVIEGIKILGKFIEEVDFKKEAMFPDLIFCRHVLEHVAQPKELLSQLFKKCHPEALYVFEIPCFENLTEANRFDAIFHQHYHYFDIYTFQRMIKEAGGEYIAHTYNRQGSCGGAMLIAFKGRAKGEAPTHSVNPIVRKAFIKQSIANYKLQMSLLSQQIKGFSQNIYGYGASLMLATLAYHLNSDLSDLICILDDDPDKDLLGYQNIPITVRYSKNIKIEPNSNFIVTSLENSRAIFKKIMELSPRRVLVPLIN